MSPAPVGESSRTPGHPAHVVVLDELAEVAKRYGLEIRLVVLKSHETGRVGWAFRDDGWRWGLESVDPVSLKRIAKC